MYCMLINMTEYVRMHVHMYAYKIHTILYMSTVTFASIYVNKDTKRHNLFAQVKYVYSYNPLSRAAGKVQYEAEAE